MIWAYLALYIFIGGGVVFVTNMAELFGFHKHDWFVLALWPACLGAYGVMFWVRLIVDYRDRQIESIAEYPESSPLERD